jgi:hypothetical protein
VCVPYLALGEDCSDELGECIDGFCNDNGKCANLPTVGQDCTGADDCADGWCDDENTGKCVAYALIDQPCGTPNGQNVYLGRCESSARCVGSICQADCREP